MKALILEGIATSGKSAITERIVKQLSGKMTVEVAAEEQTHEPIMEERNDLHIQFFQDLISQMVHKKPDLLIFDRLYITQAYRAHSDLTPYAPLEDMLLPYSPHTIILKVAEDTIADRIKASAEQRGKQWQDFWKTKGDTYEEVAQGYIEQQRGLLELVKQSKIPYSIFDTTGHDYEEITKQILEIIRK